MQDLGTIISAEIKKLTPLHVKEVLDFIEFLQLKQEKGDDTEYLQAIPGMTESINEEAARPLSEYSEKLDW